ncbi:DUF935 family protein (plasmid) [Halobacillus litoralis]|uniref:phage portal protein family protein n=1 Tax=Halobacillus litoralis TaxID=45668 RepID=UPI001CFC5968|nr:DUF935 family protein [Halobacillus litoralis]WLR49583.1 DUF935 family protein [Halobacillus litoralis]
MGVVNYFKERINGKQPKELNEDELMGELSLYKLNAWEDYANGTDTNPDMIGIETYNKMRSTDSTVKAGIESLKLPILAKGYDFKFEDREMERKEENKEKVDFLIEVFNNMDHHLDKTLEEMLTAIWAGFSVTEPVYQRIKEGEFKGKLGLKKMKVINPANISFEVNDYGDVINIVQEIGDRKIKIPKEKAIHYVHSGEFQNPYGNSDLQAVYKHWFIKDKVIKFSNIALERVGTPLIYGKAKNSNEVGKLQNILDQVMSRNSLAISGADEIGVLDSSRTMPFLDYINHHNKMMLRGLMIPSLLLGNDSGQAGSYSLSEQHFNIFLFRLQSIQTDLENAINEKVVKRLIDLNFGKQAVYPKIKFRPLMEKDKNTLSDIFFKLVNAQILDPELDSDWIRDELGLPQASQELKDYVKEEKDIELEQKKVALDSAKKSNEKLDQEEEESEEDDKEGKGNPTSNGTTDSGSHPYNSSGRGKPDDKEK